MRTRMVAAALAAGQPLLQHRHAHHRVGRALALIALVALRPRHGLLHRVAREDAEGAGNARRELDALNAPCSLAAHVVVMVRLAADDRPQAGDTREAAGLGAPLRGDRQLEGTGDLVGVDGRRAHAAVVEALHGAVEQALGELLVEGSHADRELQATQEIAFFFGERLPGGLLTHPPARPPALRAPRAPPRAVARRGSAPRRAAAPGGGACGRGVRAWFAGTPRCVDSEPPGSGAER